MKLDYHDFQTKLVESEKPANYLIYLTAVTHWWSDALAWERVTDLEEQKKGKDVVISLSDGKVVVLQFKIRSNDYGDILIEYRHDFPSGRQKPGWIEQPSDADFLIYCTPGRLYRIDYETLHIYWEWNKKNMIAKYDLPPAKNKDYVTRNVAIPISILQDWVSIDELEIKK